VVRKDWSVEWKGGCGGRGDPVPHQRGETGGSVTQGGGGLWTACETSLDVWGEGGGGQKRGRTDGRYLKG